MRRARNLARVNPAAWYPDPFGRYEYRFHNGTSWTADVSMNGIRYVDPLGAAPSGSPPGPPQRTKRDGLATASLVLGIIALCTSWVPVLFVAGAVCAVLAVIFGTVAIRRRKAENRGFALAGLLTGGGGLMMVGVGVWTTSLVVDEVDEFTNPPPADVDITRCTIGDSRLVVAGTIENRGSRASDYRIVLDVSGIGLRERRVVITVEDVGPGVVHQFETPIRGLDLLDDDDKPSCVVDEITGPLPFGLDIDPD
jgi:hypothetical protein